MGNIKPITIVGAGLSGSIIAFSLLKLGMKVQIIDSGNIFNRKYQQEPWGWRRRISLHAKVKTKYIKHNNFLDEFHTKIMGPMLISTKNNTTYHLWKQWIQNNNTNAYVLSPNEACNEFTIPRSYFSQNNEGGIFVCDNRDYLMNFNNFNRNMWDYLSQQPNCELIPDELINKIGIENNKVIYVGSNNNIFFIDKLILCLGNQTNNLLRHIGQYIPIMNIKLPYIYKRVIVDKPYISLWNKESTINYFPNSIVKIGCGSQSLFVNNNDLLSYLYFALLGLKNYKNIHFTTKEKLIQNAINELERLDITLPTNEYEYIEDCNVDLTTSLSPIVDFLPSTNNTMVITGFSGSGSMLMESWFIDAITSSIINNKLNNNLNPFKINNSLYSNWFHDKDKLTPISALN